MAGAGLRCLAHLMEACCRNIGHLCLASNDLRAEDGDSIASILQTCNHLTHLDLAANQGLGDDGMKPIADALSHATDLRRLDLTTNHLHAPGAKTLSKGMANCPSLEWLSVVGNPLGDEGAHWMAAAVKNCKPIKELRMDWTMMSKIGVARLARASSPERNVVFGLKGAVLVTRRQQQQLSRAWRGRCVLEWK
eukprot:3183128-Rhodomonas_salina.1